MRAGNQQPEHGLMNDEPLSPTKVVAPSGPQVRGARLYLAKTPNFSQQDIRKSLADAEAPRDKLWHARNPKFNPHRTDADGNVTFDDQETIENYEEWARRKDPSR